ncbi:hypothetical protein [Rhizobium sp. S163]|uniref:hypothetical protein n=1 Tax=Rhizobium sp. S163 TaxID=3055039 RepID=UPI0025A96B3B|nr:hypothetical protein [Rhizobium sp. S163]MDM9645562.1 hypothetical protein [Rhizobium sp. S163]
MTSTRRAISSFQEGVNSYIEHLHNLELVFNRHSREVGLGVLISVADTIAAARSGMLLDRVGSFFQREDDSGVLHEAQLLTAVDCILRMIDNPGQNGVVLGAMQSGKTTTSLALQFAGPIIYALTGRLLYPIYLTTSHTSQEDQTKIELLHFLNFYGSIKIELDPEGPRVLWGELDPGFEMSPTINFYRGHLLRDALGDIHLGPQLEDFVHRRVQGQRLLQISDLCRRAQTEGFETLLMIDEPQYGASDRIIINTDGNEERRPCVLVQIFDAIEQAMNGNVGQHSFIGLSATPYEMHELESVWVVRQYLTSAYRGFNYFGGTVISDQTVVVPPDTMGFTEFSRRLQIPIFTMLSMAAYNASGSRFPSLARKLGYTGTQAEYQEAVRTGLRTAILQIIAEADPEGSPIGICIRPFNNNAAAAEFVRRLDLEREGVEIIPYYGAEYSGSSVKRAIRARMHPNRPFVIVVTNRARMGDAFPSQVKWFVDFATKASDLNSLLQGLLGRACGYGKQSVVLLSDDNAALVDDYRRTQGGYFYKTSRHSIIVGGYRRGAPSGLIRLKANVDDPVVRTFFERIEREVVDGRIIQNRATLQTTRNRSGEYRTGPILRLAEETGLFDHLEQADVAERLFPQLPGGFEIVRAGGTAQHTRDADRRLSYTLDGNGDCRFTFRWTADETSHTGLASRGYGARDATDRAKAADGLEPQIHMEKFDPKTGEVIFDKRDAIKREGHWRARMITLPLVEPVRELQEGLATYPNDKSAYRRLMNAQEEQNAGFID